MANFYFFRQFLVILGLCISGFAFVRLSAVCCGKKKFNNASVSLAESDIFDLLLALPVGLSLWGVLGFLILVAGIPYCRSSIAAAYALVFCLLGFFAGYVGADGKAKLGIGNASKKGSENDKKNRRIVFWTVAVLFIILLSALCCSGILKITLSNDSYYYYSVYPQTIVKEGSYLTSYDVFLTDVGQTCAIIGTLPWLFGFEEIYGIQLLLGFNLLGIFAYAVYSMHFENGINSELKMGFLNKRLIFTLLAVVFLAVQTPFVIMTRWILANAYFMSLIFTLLVLAQRMMSDQKHREKIMNNIKDTDKTSGKSGLHTLGEHMITTSLMAAMVSMLRMEGGMMVGLLILCMLGYEINNKQLLTCFVIPAGITQILYYMVVYLKLTVNPLYSFLDFKNAAIMLGFIFMLFVYIAFIRGRYLNFLQKNIKFVVLLALLLGNLVLCIINPQLYLGNLKFFALNIYIRNGWGYFGFIMAVFVLVIVIIRAYELFKRRASFKEVLHRNDFFVYLLAKISDAISFPFLFTVSYCMFTVAVCWARDGTLRLGIGDSGNRVLMQVIPFAVYAVVIEVQKIIARD